jgi:hypothetical protein
MTKTQRTQRTPFSMDLANSMAEGLPSSYEELCQSVVDSSLLPSTSKYCKSIGLKSMKEQWEGGRLKAQMGVWRHEKGSAPFPLGLATNVVGDRTWSSRHECTISLYLGHVRLHTGVEHQQGKYEEEVPDLQ